MIRKVTKVDIEKVSDLLAQSDKLSEKCQVFVLEEDKTIKGCAAIKIVQHNDSKKCIVESIAVDDNYRRQGIGKRIFDFLKSYADEQSCNSVELDVKYDDYDAVDFSAIIGFRPQALNLIMDLK